MVQSKFLFLLAVTLANVYYWRSRGVSQKLLEATAARDAQLRAAAGVGVETEAQDCEEIPDVVYIDSYEGSAGGGYPTLPEIYGVDAVDFDQYRAKYLGFFRIGDDISMILNFEGGDKICDRFVNMYQARGDRMVTDFTLAIHSCVAVARVASKGLNGTSHNLLRYDIASIFDEADDAYAKKEQKNPRQRGEGQKTDDGMTIEPMKMRVPTGMFTKVSRKRNREKVNRKMTPFFTNFNAMDSFVDGRLRSRGFQPGDNIVLMVVNVGEVDLFMNFACSCRFHDISMEKMVVFVANKEIVNIIESTGALALHSTGFAGVNPEASKDYLDFTFVDMMWYKAFSLWMIIKRGYNVLFQDVDLVWFRDPFPFIKNMMESPEYNLNGHGLDAVLTDDGQRGLRYSPFYANSGFYYFKASQQASYFAWSIMMGFPMIQRTGSHQNVFTARLMETMDLGKLRTKLLNLEEFPNGYNYHHNKSYMVDFLVEKKYQPYNFHMCWTQRKADKLNYFRKTLMWYLDDNVANIETLGNDPKTSSSERSRNPLNSFHNSRHQNFEEANSQWESQLSRRICKRSPNSP